jgi:cysteinyl-tRNA synthetase
VTLRLFDTASRTVREFRPVTHGKAAVYLCGATVQGAPHLGHLRSAVCFDILVRWLEASGQQVTYCRNVTDIDDKILRAAAAEEIPWWALAERYHREFTSAYALVGCRPPDVEPRATGHIPDMIALIGRLVRNGHAYLTGGDVYFDVNSDQDYGTLSRPPGPSQSRKRSLRTRGRRRETQGTSSCGRARSRASLPGRHHGAAAVLDGTSSARRWPSATSGPRSTSTGAART